MKTFSISHISHGVAATGGFRHEQFLLDKLAEHFNESNVEVEKETIRANRFFKGFSQSKLLWWSFIRSNADVNIVVARTALSSIIRNIFSKRKTLVVLHYFDERDGKGLGFKWYYDLLFLFLVNFKFSNVAIIAVAPFWVKYFEDKLNKNIPVHLFPNFFDLEKYKSFVTQQKLHKIHLGQFSFKNDKRIYELAKILTLQGFTCYFSTMIKEEAGNFDDYQVVFEDEEAYLNNMASCAYTIAFIGINEGWNRVAHESILVGTTLIGNDAGGLADLINESVSLKANNVEEFIDHISQQHQSIINPNFAEKYDEKNAEAFQIGRAHV